jgi:ribosomal protein L16 Arg81 hydroxylase
MHFPDREEVYAAGDAFYVPAGHAPIAEAGTEILQFSPTEDLQVTNAAIMKNMQAMQAG